MIFTKALSFIKGILGSASVITPILALFGVAIPPAALAVVPMVLGLMNQAEEALGDGTGPLKKAAVEAGAIGFVEGMQVASTGGQKETWEKITPETVSVLIDTIATVANGISKVSGGNQIFDDSQFDINKMSAGA